VAREFELDAKQANQAAAMAQKILTGEAAWAWDAAQIDWHGNELAITVAGSARRIDRLVRRKPLDQGDATRDADGEWWVLDYKSATHTLDQPTLVAQLTHYRDAVQAIYPGQTVKAAFLSAQGTLDQLRN
jgi:ATP-dependent helicase/nuclease subunit A